MRTGTSQHDVEDGAPAPPVRLTIPQWAVAGPVPAAAGVFLLVLLLTLSTSSFATEENVGVIARAAAITIVVALAQMVVVAAGGLNLSVGAIGGLVAAVCGGLMNSYGVPPALAVLAGLGVGTASGALSGVVIARFGISSFIVTLASGSIITSIALSLTKSVPYYSLPVDFRAFGNASVAGVSVIFVVTILVAVAIGVIFKYGSFGRQVLAFGANPRATELNGVPVGRLQVAVFALSGLLASIASVLLIARLGDADPTIGSDWLLVSFAAPIIGGARLAGGYVSVLGTVLAAILFCVLLNGFVHWNIDVSYVQLLFGLVILLAAASDRIRQVSSEAAQRRQRRNT
jgi:ribose transport system permease protein